jgi:hypothetical protein
MAGLFFIEYLFFLGFFFAANFRLRLSFPFILISSFLWGSLLFSLGLFFIHLLGILPSEPVLIILSVGLVSIPVLFLAWKKSYRLFSRFDFYVFICTAVTIFLINLFFQTYNFSLATIDSFALLMLGRTISFEGFSPAVLYSFTSWGVLIPLIQSMSTFLKVSYLPTLEVNFALTLLSLFVYSGINLGKQMRNSSFWVYAAAAFFGLLLITTPMFVIQSFYIHTNLPAACFFLAASTLLFQYHSGSQDRIRVVFIFLSCLGLSLCRTETFIFSIPILVLLLISHSRKDKSFIISSLIFLGAVIGWLVFLFSSIEIGTDILDKDRIFILVVSLIALVAALVLLQIEKVGQKIAPVLNKYFLLPFVIINLVFLVIKPAGMITGDLSIIQNLLFFGYWGVIFWIWIFETVLSFFIKDNPILILLNKIIASVILVVSGLGFFRNPYRLSWTDSANRLMTLIFPLVLLAALLCVHKLLLGDWRIVRESRVVGKK